MAKTPNLIPMLGLVVATAFFVLCWVVVGDSGSVVGSPIQVFGLPGTILLYVTILFTFATIYVAARRAHHAGSWFWFFSVILIWPLSYFYALVVNRDG